MFQENPERQMNFQLIRFATFAVVLLVAASHLEAAQDSHAKSSFNQPPEQLKKGIEGKHPMTYYFLALKLFDGGKKDDAVFWYYVGQLRYRFHLAANPDLKPSGDPALFTALSHTAGRPLNEYAFGDMPKLVKTIDMVLEWDAKHDNGFTSKAENKEKHDAVRAALVKFKKYVVEHEEDIKKQRKANGLENRQSK